MEENSVDVKGMGKVTKDALGVYLEAGIVKEILDLEKQERCYELVNPIEH